MTRRLVLWRHGRTRWNATGRTQGQSDVDLDDEGRKQAATAASRLASLAPARLVSSDLRRAADTARALARPTGLRVAYDPRLREVHFGQREGTTPAEAARRWPDLMARREAGEDVRFPGAETNAEVAERFSAALRDVADGLADSDTAVLVAHGSAMRVGSCRFLGLPEQHWGLLGAFANCAWAVLTHGRRGWRIEEWNAGSLPEPVVGDDA